MDTDEVTALIEQVAVEVITPRFRALADEQVMEKKPGDLVTIADREAEVVLTEHLTRAYPDAVVLGEEAHSADPSVLERFRAAEHAFTVDPVDGTKNFVHGSPDHAVMVAEVRAGEVVRSWIHQPQHGRSYVAERGAGAWLDGTRMPMLAQPPQRTQWQVHTSWRSRIGQVIDGLPALQLSWVCCGVDYPRVAEGTAQAIWYGSAAAWDHAPGALLLHEVGGLTGQDDGAQYRVQEPSGSLLATGGREIYRDLVRTIAADDAGR